MSNIKAILVYGPDRKLADAYYPNNIGQSAAELIRRSKDRANRIGGYTKAFTKERLSA